MQHFGQRYHFARLALLSLAVGSESPGTLQSALQGTSRLIHRWSPYATEGKLFLFLFQRAIFFKTGTPHTKRRRAKRRSRARRGRGRAGRKVHSPDGRGGDLGSREGGRNPKTVTQSVVFREEARPCRAVSHGTMTGARQRNSGGRMRLVGAAGRGCLREQLK